MSDALQNAGSETSQNTMIVAALVNLVRLLAAELVAGHHREDVDKLIAAMDNKISQTPLPRGIEVNDARAALKAVRQLLRPAVQNVQAQAASARMDDAAKKSPVCSKHIQ
jgi:hypothetical protein